ncbi:hypothetical protein J0B03_05050 [Alkalibacter rhizosphaerae]|uniref:DUF5655 domain-containing protein n=1 Tax=Alkalibacter rhizosphaerae TaxID=2815577 RepID=A0A974XGH8_9FIRM|nr:DUF5655 domain-containing protein [Alkalibacter rhizosphaerae]QSX09434.1 hypothetical protein J0B03_05050 [Alkalibacter rhizosphaerae]
MDQEKLDLFFAKKPQLKSLFLTLDGMLRQRYGSLFFKVQKSQISFCDPRPFCWVWLPIRDGIKGRPEEYLVVSFGLDHEIRHSRLIEAVEPYPGRWTHHTIVSKETELDEELMGWILEAHEWMVNK